MVGVIGVKHPSIDGDNLVITDIAVCPKMKGMGIGSTMLSELSRLYPNVSHSNMVAYVATSNARAIAFFAKNKWVQIKDEEQGDDMIKFIAGSLEDRRPDTNAFSSQ